MRCKNCGWDNHEENVKCEKCNVSLSSYEIEELPLSSDDDTEEFNSKNTYFGCSTCGYPVRPTETECPICGHAFSDTNTGAPENKKSDSGTIIQGASADKDFGNGERKRLVAFLVTYSNSANGDFFPLFEGKNYIGRGRSLQVSIQGDTKISEKHVSILFRPVDRKFKFKDEQSSNGTFINDALIDEGELNNLDVIRIGATRLLFIEIPQNFIA